MNRSQLRRYEMLVRVQDFGVAQVEQFPKPGLAHDRFKEVADVVEQLAADAVAKLTSVKGTINKANVRAELVGRLETVAQTGRVIVESTQGLEDKFIMPVDPSDQALIMTAKAFASDAEGLKTEFIAHLMPKTFLADLEAAIAAFEQAIKERQAGKDARLAARTRIENGLAAGMAAARALDAMVTNRLQNDAATMAVWERDRRVIWPSRPHKAVAGKPVQQPEAPTGGGTTTQPPVVTPPSPPPIVASPTPAVATPAAAGTTNEKAA